MRVFQNSGIYPAYLPRLNALAAGAHTFAGRLAAFLEDRYAACHILAPIYSATPEAFFTNGDDERLQRMWGREHGMPASASREQILISQIEDHRAEVFYNLDPMRFGNAFLQRLPGCVRVSIAWRAAPSAGGEFNRHHAVVCNFPGILEHYRAIGMRAEYFCPGHDSAMDAYAANTERPVDILFIGGYSRHHRNRAEVLEGIARHFCDRRVVYHLDRSKMTRLAESPIGLLLGLKEHRRPACIRRISTAPVFGRDLYRALSLAKVVINGAVDMAGPDRGNMRCFEAMGCGALMVSDRGRYPEGMEEDETLLAYSTPEDAVRQIEHALSNPSPSKRIALNGHRLVSTRYSKARQWLDFCNLVQSL